MAIGYIIFPFDFVPDFLPVLGWLEDIVIGWVMFNYVNRTIAIANDVSARKKDDSDIITVEAKVIGDD